MATFTRGFGFKNVKSWKNIVFQTYKDYYLRERIFNTLKPNPRVNVTLLKVPECVSIFTSVHLHLLDFHNCY